MWVKVVCRSLQERSIVVNSDWTLGADIPVAKMTLRASFARVFSKWEGFCEAQQPALSKSMLC